MIPKFRGKSIDKSNKGKWVYGNLIVDGNNALIVNGIVECEEDYVALGDWCPVDLKTVGQSTGMFDKNGDKNGVEIFEGDVVEYIDGEFSFIGKVIKSQLGTYVTGSDNHSFEDFTDETTMVSDVSVLGNIYENPDLLERVEE